MSETVMIPIQRPVLQAHPHAIALEVQGRGMAPDIPQGSYIVIDAHIPLIHDNPGVCSRWIPREGLAMVGTVVWILAPVTHETTRS